MKKKIRGISLFIGIVLSFVFAFPVKAYDLTSQTHYVNINDRQTLEVGNLTFHALSFKDYSATSTQAFGLTGRISNSSNNTISYTSTAYYYDSNYNLVAYNTDSKSATAGTADFNQMSNLSILAGHNIKEIYYYNLLVTVLDIPDIAEPLTEMELTPSKNSQHNYRPYVIDKYNVDIIVNENNTLDITETITAYFNVPKHGIFRTIPLKNTLSRLDGTQSTNRTQITNLSVNAEYKTSKNNGNYKIQIGSASKTLTGEQTYIIKYTYNLGKDPMEAYDELYYNIIGSSWDTVIGNVTFSVTMPKNFDSSKLGFSSGRTGSVANGKIKYNVNGNKITGSYNGILGVGEALTVRCELPEGYFVNAGLKTSILDYICFLIPIIFLLITILIWYKFGRDDQVVETVEFYPPQGINSLEAGFLYKGRAENKDITSLLIYLANQGYLEILDSKISSKRVALDKDARENAEQKIIELQSKITEERKTNPSSPKIRYYENMLDIYKNIDTPINYEQYGLKSPTNKSNKKDKFVIRKLKDYDGQNVSERLFMDGLFKYGETEVTDSMLYNTFYITNSRIRTNMNRKKNKEKIFEKSSTNKRILIILMLITVYCAITIPPAYNYGQSDLVSFAIIFPSIGFSVLVAMLTRRGPVIEKIFGIVWGGLFGGVPWALIMLPILTDDVFCLIGYIIGVICIIGMIICLTYIPKRTPYGNEMLGKLRGFKRFLETAEKGRLESLVMENPNYFYDILPYSYVLGVSNKWIKKFEVISLQEPNWYYSSNDFDFRTFDRFINSTMRTAQTAMTSSPSSSGGGGGFSGGSSGGGSSGGGSGGGGGGSW